MSKILKYSLKISIMSGPLDYAYNGGWFMSKYSREGYNS